MGHIRSSHAVVLVAVLTGCACDPGVYLQPVGWKPSGTFRWESESHGVRFFVGSLGGLIGSSSTSFEIAAQNNSAGRFVLDEATLETNGRTFKATFSGQGEEKWRSAAPGAMERIELLWSFEQPMSKALGDVALVRLAFHIGQTPHQLTVEFRRASAV
jgi:hypothetical protein